MAILIEQYLFSEQLLPTEFRSHFRRTLALLGDVDYDLSDYDLILRRTLLDKSFGDSKKQIVQKQIRKSLYTVHLCLNIIWSWSKNDGNSKNAVLTAERTVLLTWQFIQEKQPSIKR